MVTKKLLFVPVVAVLAVAFVAAPELGATGNRDHKVGICHATGSSTNPYVYINVSKSAADAHKRHQDGRDIIGVESKDDCPKATAVVAGAQTTRETPADDVQPAQEMPTELPKTGAGALFSAVAGIGSLGYAATAYIRSRKNA